VDRDWLADLAVDDDHADVREDLDVFRGLVRRWQQATLLPIDQLILTLAQDLFHEPADLAVAHKLAVLLRRASEMHRDWRLPELTQELAVVARNERRFLGLSGDDIGFDPERYKGKVVVATVHKAKGLEWDRVHLVSVNNYNFPSALPHDSFISEKWYVRDSLNLVEEALAQLKALVSGSVDYMEGDATETARLDYASERLRLLYVGITRAKKELIITWNTGRRGDQQPSVPFVALQTFWEEQGHEATK
jgi:DNA helicase-2/ATP-dependent DNA helicase PcrA